MNWVLAVVLCILTIEAAVRLPFVPLAARARGTAVKAIKVVRSEAASDHWKERVMLAYAGVMLGCTIRLSALLLTILAFAAVVVIAFNQVHDGFLQFLLNSLGFLFSMLVTIGYFAVRRRILD